MSSCRLILSDINYFHIQLCSYKADFKSYYLQQSSNGNQLKIKKSFNWLEAIEGYLLPRKFKSPVSEKLDNIVML